MADFVKYTRDSIMLILARIRKTLPGNDNIPYLVYCDCAHELSEIITMPVNISLGLVLSGFGVVPSVWHTVVITRVPKSIPVG